MGHRVATRIVLALVGVLLAAALGFAWHRSNEVPSREPGERAPAGPPASFARYCAACHAPEELAAPLTTAADPTTAVLDALELLADHGEADLAEDLEIVRWLLALPPPEGEGAGR